MIRMVNSLSMKASRQNMDVNDERCGPVHIYYAGHNEDLGHSFSDEPLWDTNVDKDVVEQILISLNDQPVWGLFDQRVCSFFKVFSRLLMERGRSYPDLVSCGYFIRNAHMHYLKEAYNDTHRCGRGVTFHISPSNVPLTFAYNLYAALCSGNCCIIKIPSRRFRQVDLFMEILHDALKQCNDSALMQRFASVRYARTVREITDLCSASCAVRVIWGGDKTIASVRKSPLMPRAFDMTFSNRFSIAVLDAKVIQNMTDIQLSRLSVLMYNDTFLYDQNACSSPRLLYWIGNPAIQVQASDRFWDVFHRCVAQRYDLAPIIAIDKCVALCDYSIAHKALRAAPALANLIFRVNVSKQELTPSLIGPEARGGFFYEYVAPDLSSLDRIISSACQTITYVGDRDLIANYVKKSGCRGGDRIVPVGHATDFSFIWDGYDILLTLSREIVVQ